MAGRRSKKKLNEVALEELVTVAFAEDMELAKQYKEMLNENSIPAIIKKNASSTPDVAAIAILVPEDDLDEAHIMIAQQGVMADFYGMALSENSYEDIDADFYETDY